MSYMRAAFEKVCKERKSTEVWYVCLMEKTQRYGGPEEGGWWTSDSICIEYQECNTRELAEKLRNEVQHLASEMTKSDKDRHNRVCADQVDWLEARGLDADDNSVLPEPDGPTEYYVVLSQEVPTPRYGPTHYE